MTTRTVCARLVMGLMTAGLVALGGRHPAQAAGVVGTGTAGSCTESALTTALSGGGLVTFNCGAAPVTIALTTTNTITTDTTVDGGGTITLAGTAIQTFNIQSGADFTVRNLTLSGATNTAIFNTSSGTVTATNCTFSAHTIDINSDDTGAVIVTNCTFASTSVTNILNNGTGPVIATNCTFAGSDAGIDSDDSAPVTATNCTFSGNQFFGIVNNGPITATDCTFFFDSIGISTGDATITNCTFADNQTGISNTGTATATNCILASPFLANCSGNAVIDGGHNLDSDGTCNFASGTTNPQLDPAGLANNGGPTQTIAVLITSPAINAGDQAVCAAPPVNNRDQRGYVRPGDHSANCTIGAFEFAAAPPVSPAPALSPAGLLGLLGLLAAGGMLALSRRPAAK